MPGWHDKMAEEDLGHVYRSVNGLEGICGDDMKRVRQLSKDLVAQFVCVVCDLGRGVHGRLSSVENGGSQAKENGKRRLVVI